MPEVGSASRTPGARRAEARGPRRREGRGPGKTRAGRTSSGCSRRQTSEHTPRARAAPLRQRGGVRRTPVKHLQGHGGRVRREVRADEAKHLLQCRRAHELHDGALLVLLVRHAAEKLEAPERHLEVARRRHAQRHVGRDAPLHVRHLQARPYSRARDQGAGASSTPEQPSGRGQRASRPRATTDPASMRKPSGSRAQTDGRRDCMQVPRQDPAVASPGRPPCLAGQLAGRHGRCAVAMWTEWAGHTIRKPRQKYVCSDSVFHSSLHKKVKCALNMRWCNVRLLLVLSYCSRIRHVPAAAAASSPARSARISAGTLSAGVRTRAAQMWHIQRIAG